MNFPGLPARGGGARVFAVTAVVAVLLAGCAPRPGMDAARRAPPCASVGGTLLAADALLDGAVTVDTLAPKRRPAHAFRIDIPVDARVDGVCAAGVRLQVPVREPVSGTLVQRPVPVSDVRLDAGRLVITVAGPVARRSWVLLAAGALRRGAGYSAATRVVVDGPLSPRQAALWFKPYAPRDRELFPAALFYHPPPNSRVGAATPAPALRPPFADDGELLAALGAQYRRFVRAGRLSPARAARYLALVRDPAARRVFTGPDGVFRPLLMAAVLANAGTVGEPAIAALIGGDNATGRPARVLFDPSIQGHLAETGVAGGRLIVRINPRQAFPEPFALLAPVVGAHEAFHQDNRVGRDEEVIAAYATYVAAAQQYLANPALARAGTRLAKVMNARILAMLNSGRGTFPRPGLLPVPRRQAVAEVIPGSVDAGTRPSLDAFMRQLYADVPDVSTAGNAYADRVIGALLGHPVSGIGFDRAAIRLLDAHSRALDADELFELLRILDLRLAP